MYAAPTPATHAGSVPTVTIDVLVSDWQPLFRDGVVRAIRQDAGMQLVAETQDARGALEAVRRHEPAVALVAVDADDGAGERLLVAAARNGLQTRVVLLAADPAAAVWDALGVGAAGVLSRGVDQDAVRSALRAVARGGVALCDEAQRALAAAVRERRPRDAPLLSPREHQVLELLAEGLSAPAIARRLTVEPTTVRTHVRHLCEKLDARDRAQLVRHAMRRKLLD